MREKKDFIIYHNSYTLVEELTDDEAGKLFKSLYRYSMNKEEPTFEKRSILSMAFKAIRTAIDISNKKYQEKCEKNAENINKRWNIVFIDNEELNEKKFNEKYPQGYWNPEFKMCFTSFEECYMHQMSLDSKQVREQFNNSFELDGRIKEYLKNNTVV